jgi:hypothetical protein
VRLTVANYRLGYLGDVKGPHDTGDRITELQLENSRLRQLVTDLLLEKLKLEEAAQGQKRPRDGARRVY